MRHGTGNLESPFCTVEWSYARKEIGWSVVGLSYARKEIAPLGEQRAGGEGRGRGQRASMQRRGGRKMVHRHSRAVLESRTAGERGAEVADRGAGQVGRRLDGKWGSRLPCGCGRTRAHRPRAGAATRGANKNCECGHAKGAEDGSRALRRDMRGVGGGGRPRAPTATAVRRRGRQVGPETTGQCALAETCGRRRSRRGPHLTVSSPC